MIPSFTLVSFLNYLHYLFTRTETESQEKNSNSSGKSGTKRKYVVIVPEKFFSKVSSGERSNVYKCIMGCVNKTINVNHTSLNNARRHIEVGLLYFIGAL